MRVKFVSRSEGRIRLGIYKNRALKRIPGPEKEKVAEKR
jgi:hypothetical protein